MLTNYTDMLTSQTDDRFLHHVLHVHLFANCLRPGFNASGDLLGLSPDDEAATIITGTYPRMILLTTTTNRPEGEESRRETTLYLSLNSLGSPDPRNIIHLFRGTLAVYDPSLPALKPVELAERSPLVLT